VRGKPTAQRHGLLGVQRWHKAGASPLVDMRRRHFITLLGGAAAWPLAAGAQQAGKVIRIGFIGASLNSSAMAAQYQAFLTELHELGFSEGRNIVVDYRRLDDPRGPFAVAAELMRLQVDLIVATGPEVALQAVVGASRSIPIVIMAVQYDPIARGYVSSLARPGGNITGVFYRQPELAAKQLELLTQTFPEKSRLAVLYDTNSADQFSAAEEAARSMPLELQPLKLEKPPYDFGAAFQTMAQGGAQMVLVLSSPFFVERRPEVAALAIEHRLPTMFVFKSYVEAGGLMSYGVEQLAMYRRIGLYVAKILNGTKPADLPVEQPTKFELIVNLKTAKAIGIELPTSILLRADEVIE
jgi:putative ABC transport system substrate-binding protein